MQTLRSIITIASMTVAGACLGFFIGKFFGEQTSGAIAGTLILFPAGLAVATGRRRFSFMIVLNIFYAFSYYAGNFQGVLLALAASALTFVFVAMVYRGIFEDSAIDALIYQTKFAIGMLNEFQIIEDGKTVLPANAKLLLGPRLLIIKPQNAAILEQGSKQTRILGPEIATLGPFEYVKQIIDLRTRSKNLYLSGILTRESVPVNVSLSVTFRFSFDDKKRSGSTKLKKKDLRKIRTIHYNWPDWEKNTLAVIEGAVQRLIRSEDLETLLGTGNYFRREAIIRNLVNDRTKAWFVTIDRITISKIELDKGIIEANIQRYVADVKAETTRIYERARADATSEMLGTIAEGYTDARHQGMTDSDLHREVLRRTLEEILSNPSIQVISMPELSTLLSTLQNNQNQHT